MQELSLDIINNDKDLFWHHKQRRISTIGKHFQNYYEITLILDGETKNITNSTNNLVKKNDMFLMNKNIVHEMSSTNKKESLKYFNIAFSENIMQRIHAIFPDFLLVSDVIICHLNEDRAKKIINYYNESNINDSYLEIDKDMELLLYQMIKELIYSNQRSNHNFPNWFQSLLLEIQQLENIGNVNDIFKKSPYSKQYTIKIFKKYINLTPSQYLNKKKIDYAIELLLSSDLSITNIAFQCQFNNVEYFDKIFKKYTGFTPIRYKTTLQKMIKEINQ